MLQLMGVAGGLTALPISALQDALTALYAAEPQRWQQFMDEADVLIAAAARGEDSGFADTQSPGDR